MAQENSNSTMEMGTSDQVLVASKRKKTLTYTIGGLAMVVVVAVVVTLVVVLSGNEGDAQPIVSTTVVPTTPISTTAAPIISTSTAPPEPTPAPEEEDLLDLESIINGVFTPATFNGTWTSGNDVLFRSANGDLVLYDVDSNSTLLLISNTSQLLQQSSRVTVLSKDGELVMLAHNVIPIFRYSFYAHYTAVNKFSGDHTIILPPGTNASQAFLQNFQWGPTGTSLAYVYENNIYYQPNITSEPELITDTGEPNVIYNGIPDWVYEEEVFSSSNAMWFSADGTKLAYVTFNDTEVRRMKVPHYGVPGSVDYQYTQHHELRYPKPGTINPTVFVTLRDLDSTVESVYNAPTDLNEPILKSVQFVNNNAIAIMWTNRVQTQLLVTLCPFEGTCSQIFTYTETNGWIDNIPFIFNQAGNAFITILPQFVNGRLFKQIVQISDINASMWTASGRTKTPHTVTKILKWTSDDVVWYEATHVNDTAQQHVYSVSASSEVVCFTCNVSRTDGGECLYNEGSLSEDGARIAINCAGPHIPQTLIYNTDGTRLATWDTNEEISSLLDGHSIPQTVRITLPSADIQLQVPSDYLNRTNVPLLVYVYGGPDTALVTRQWNIDWGTSLVARWGIAIAHIDGRGSGLRGVENMFTINRKLGTYEIEDQIAVTRYLQQHHSWIDSNRTCIWGWSYGGYASSLALARGGEVFRCAAAVAPVVDWRFYDTIYTERYMGLPSENAAGYAQSSLLTDDVVEAFRNKRYMLIHGTADDNVHFQHSMLISRLLQRRNVYFTQMTYTDEDHALTGVRPHLYHGLEKFLQENML
ncbi:unnamed protein product [Diatraea saccharalis]|uniref:Venom dipeptidyl peptidase 4 n=1 Tax=Diatraea saccharalis TaxID=40085 RepID=A0A9N9WEP2_9NEOP|nr:unnamed protein product [Diatraea saccharalis]